MEVGENTDFAHERVVQAGEPRLAMGTIFHHRCVQFCDRTAPPFVQPGQLVAPEPRPDQEDPNGPTEERFDSDRRRGR